MKLNFQGLEMQKLYTPTDRPQGVDQKNGVHLSSYNVKNDPLLVFSADDSKKIVTVWGK